MTKIALIAVTATALILTAGTALANSQSSDNGFAVYQQSIQKNSATRSFLSGSNYDGADHVFSNNGRDAREFEKVQERDSVFTPSRSFLSGSDYDGNDHIVSTNGRDALEFRKTQEQGR